MKSSGETVKILCCAFARDLRWCSQKASGEAATAAELHPDQGLSWDSKEQATAPTEAQQPAVSLDSRCTDL